MDTLFLKVAGLDVHLKAIQVAVRCRQDSGKLVKQVRSFGTMTRDLRALADYLQTWGVTHVAMEATGEFWKPVWNVLEGRFTLLLVNPRHLKKVPGRKTDVTDAEWIAQLLQCGLLRGSFVPPRPLRQLRDLTRHRTRLVGEHTRMANRIHKVLEDANIKLGAVAHSLLVIIYHILKNKVEYHDLGTDYFDRLEPERLRRYLVKRLQHLGYDVTLSTSNPDDNAA